MKKKFRKGLSLFLAVMMVMSCWVFAPMEAGAVNGGSYTIRIGAWVGDEPNNGNKVIINYGYYTGNGANRTNYDSGDIDVTNSFLVGDGVFTEVPIALQPGQFPTYIRIRLKPTAARTAAFDIKSFTINDTVIEGQRNNASAPTIANGNVSVGVAFIGTKDWDFAWRCADYSGSGGASNNRTIANWKLPYANSIEKTPVNAPATNPTSTSISVPQTGSETTTAKFCAKDQYGVVLATNVSGSSQSCTISTSDGSTAGITVSNGSDLADGQNFTAYVSNAAKMWDGDSKFVYFNPSFTFNGKTATLNQGAQFTLNDCKYTYTYNGNNGTVSPTEEIRNYGNSVSIFPKSGTRAGYDFLGMYPNAINNYDFARPTGVPGILTTGNRVAGNQTWYAGWWAKNYKLTFLDSENKVFEECYAKYDKAPVGYMFDNGGSSFVPGEPAYKPAPGQSTGESFNKVFDNWMVSEAKDANGRDYDAIVGMMIDDPALNIKGDTVFIPVYNLTQNNYSVKFYNTDGSPMLERDDCKYREWVKPDTDPTKAADETFTYDFKGWAVQYDTADKLFVVDENGVTDDGKSIGVVTDFAVRHNTVYVPVFEKHYIEYSVTFKGYDDGKISTASYHWGDEIAVPEVKASYTKNGKRFIFKGWDKTVETTCKGTVVYNADYDVEAAKYTIIFNDINGNELAKLENVEHDAEVTEYRPEGEAYKFRDSEYEYTFEKWSPDFQTTAAADMVYTPVYAKSKLYTVTYINDGSYFASEQYTMDSALTPSVETPAKAPDEYAESYRFLGWADKDGNLVNVDGTTVIKGNTELYAKYDYTLTDYTVNFIIDGKDNITTYHWGDKIVVPADTAKAEDNTYTYTFIGWNKTPAETCTGNAEYEAVYKKTYKRYLITWLDGDGNEFFTNNQLWDALIAPPMKVPESNEAAVDGRSWVFAGWVNADTNEPFVRGEDRVSGAATYKPIFELAEITWTVKFVDENGDKLAELEVADGTALSDIAYQAPVKPGDENSHYSFDKWVSDSAEETVTADTTLTAAYKQEAHTYVDGEVVTYPTFDEDGVMKQVCSACSKETETAIPALTDEVAPSVKVIVADNKWTGEEDINVSHMVSPNDYFVVNTVDHAAPENYNETGRGSGVNTIEYKINDGGYKTIFDFEEYKQNIENPDIFEANTNELLKNIGINDGETFTITVRVTDKKGNSTEIKAGTFVYDAVAPTVELTSDCGNGSKFCLDATVSFSDNNGGVTATLDGAEIESGTKVTEPGVHQVIAVDAAGNKTAVSFEIVGDHDMKTYRVEPTCTVDGYQLEKCQLCGLESEKISIEAMGHDTDEGVYTDPTCLEDGYTTYTCLNCGEQTVVTDEGTAKGEHTYAEENDGWVIVTPATCKKDGYKYRDCTACGETEYGTIARDPDAHNWGRETVVKPDCTHQGYTTKTCKTCGKVEEPYNFTDPTGHSGVWVDVTKATCTEKGSQEFICDKCGEFLDETRETEALGHNWRVKEVVEPTGTEEGYTIYRCTRPGCGAEERRDFVAPVTEYTVTFNDENGNLIKEFTLRKGEAISKTDVTAPEKAEDEGYTYKFSAWADGDGNEYKLPILVESDMVLTAKYEAKAKTFTVIFDGVPSYPKYGDDLAALAKKHQPADYIEDGAAYKFIGWNPTIADGAKVSGDAVYTSDFEMTELIYKVAFAVDTGNVLKVYEVKHGQGITAEQLAEVKGMVPSKPGDNYNHYTFKGEWSDDTSVVTENMYVTPVYTQEAHSFTEHKKDATCTEGGGTTYKCGCGYEYSTSTTAPLGHAWLIDERIEPDFGKEGYERKHCDRCGKVEENRLPAKQYVIGTIVLTDQNHIPVSGANVAVFENGQYVMNANTDEFGKVNLAFPGAGEYTIVIQGKGFDDITGKITVSANGNVDMSRVPQIYISDCTCTCHKDGAWPAIFRFFHKIIRALTGEYKCCKCPDKRYN